MFEHQGSIYSACINATDAPLNVTKIHNITKCIFLKTKMMMEKE